MNGIAALLSSALSAEEEVLTSSGDKYAHTHAYLQMFGCLWLDGAIYYLILLLKISTESQL